MKNKLGISEAVELIWKSDNQLSESERVLALLDRSGQRKLEDIKSELVSREILQQEDDDNKDVRVLALIMQAKYHSDSVAFLPLSERSEKIRRIARALEFSEMSVRKAFQMGPYQIDQILSR